MAYVDLNPVRANLATGISDSDKTSAQQRLKVAVRKDIDDRIRLMDFQGSAKEKASPKIQFSLRDYLELIDWTSRCIREEKHSTIDRNSPRLFTQLDINQHEWLPNVTAMQSRYEKVMGSPRRMRHHAQSRGGKFCRGHRYAERLYRRLNTR